ncbi:type II secretion system protein [Candidatus Saccharibacteria bacterium]|nr:type II secretion system protein [Candidatus Saccharibacteria bacterium]
MVKEDINSKKGFTIIEVVLVLAIAGLIFLMVFIALPALQRSQRDTSRRNDMSRVDTSLVQYQTNNSTRSNNLPSGPAYWNGSNVDYFKDDKDCSASDIACQFVRDYMNSGASETQKENTFEDPDGTPYSMYITENWAVSDSITPTFGNENSKLVLHGSAGGYTIGGDSPFSEHVVYIVPGGRCDGEDVVKSEKRHFAVLYRLEGAGVYCIDDQ